MINENTQYHGTKTRMMRTLLYILQFVVAC